MKKIIWLMLFVLLLPRLSSAAQQTWSAGNNLSDVRTKIQANDTDLYGQAATKWLTGIAYTANNQSVTHGGHHFICTSSHTSGSTTEPGVGASWETVWRYSGEVLATVRTTAGGGSTVLPPSETAVGDGLNTREPALGNPGTTGYILSSTDAGVRSWIAPATGGSMTWPSTAGIPYWSSGTAWGGAYNATTKIPTDYVTNLSGTNTGDDATNTQYSGLITSKTANYVYAAPNGSAGDPSFRALVAADIPALSYQAPLTNPVVQANLGTNVYTWLGTPTIANWFSAVTGEGAFAATLMGYADAPATFTGIKQAASETATGVVELATTAEVVTGTDTSMAVTAAGVTAKMAAPGAIGGTTPAAGTFTTVTAATYASSAADGSRRSIIPENTAIAASGGGVEEIYNEAGALKAVENDTEYDILLSRDIGTAVAAPNADTTGESGSVGSNSTTGKLEVTGPATGTTRVMTTPDANFTVARTDAANSFTGNQTVDGIIRGRVPFNSYTAAQTLTAATHNSGLVQMTTADEVTMWDCETANVGDTVMLWARDAEKIEVVPASGDHFVLFGGTALTADYELDIAATAGTKVTLMCTADDTWSVVTETAASVTGGAAD